MAKCPIQEIAKRAGESGIPFLVIGGYAVIAHGYVRTTDDLDLIVQRGRRAQVGKLLADMGMSVKNDAANFAQFDSPDDTVMDVDLMFVSEEVFNQLACGDGGQTGVRSGTHGFAAASDCFEMPRFSAQQILAPAQGHGRPDPTHSDQPVGLE